MSISDSNLSRHKPPPAIKPGIPKSVSKEDVKTIEVSSEEISVSSVWCMSVAMELII